MASNQTAETVRQLADFPRNIWADRIALFTTLDEKGHELHMKEIEVLKEELVSMLRATGKTLMQKLDFIDKMERLGISYHFEDQIQDQLEQLFNAITSLEIYPAGYDLSTAALQFRLFRQHGFNISCGIFDQFVDDNGKFKESLIRDLKGLLNLYEAAHVRTHRDKILEEALDFTTTHLTREVSQMGSSLLGKKVKHALEQPFHKGIPRYEAYCHISMYEEDEPDNKSLLRLAKLDYHLSQMLNKQDLCELIRWGKELDIQSKIPYARDRLVECCFWTVGALYEPQHSLARVTLAKAIALAGIIDDTYDAYGTLHELKIFTEAVERWDGSGIDQLSDYLKNSYMTLLNFNKELEEDLAKNICPYPFDKYIEEWKQYARTNFIQSKWFLANELPSFAEYLSNGLVTTAYYPLASVAFMAMDCATEEVMEWMSTRPKIFVALAKHTRLLNDVGTYKFEKERGSGTAIECYMKDYNVSEDEAVKKFENMAEDAWKDINEECLRLTTMPRKILKVILNLARLCEVVYKKRGDGFTNQRNIEAHIKAMLVDSISL